jgi:hypothetical protein
MQCAVELKEAGIHLRKCNNTNVMNYKSRVLSLPTISIGHDGTAKIFLNMMAFERLHSDAGSEATDYMIFMDNIINSERDVALLRSKGIIKNLLSSDKEVAQLFNNLSRGGGVEPIQQAARSSSKGECTLREALEQVLGHLPTDLHEEPVGFHFPHGCCNPPHRHHPADHLFCHGLLQTLKD